MWDHRFIGFGHLKSQGVILTNNILKSRFVCLSYEMRMSLASHIWLYYVFHLVNVEKNTTRPIYQFAGLMSFPVI